MKYNTYTTTDEQMELNIEYTISHNKITVISCKGHGTSVSLPSEIKGLPITSIGAYAFSNIDKSRARLSSMEEVHTEQISGISVPGAHKDYIYGRRLQEICLPSGLEIIDEYAFYDCRELTTIHMWGGRIQFENGAFMNCEKLQRIYVKASPDEVTCINSILAEVSGEVCVTFKDNEAEGVFIFPEFYEDSIENSPARVFHYMIYGAGYRYRQCFEQGRLNIMAYDMVFGAAEIQTITQTALKIAYLRLKYPYLLLETLKGKYVEYITNHIAIAVDEMIHQEDIEGLLFLTGLKVMSEQHYIDASKEAIKTGNKECAGILLEKKLHYYPPKEKKFEL